MRIVCHAQRPGVEHKRIDETMLYVNFAGAHMRPIPPTVLLAAGTEVDPDQRILNMLSAPGTADGDEECSRGGSSS